MDEKVAPAEAAAPTPAPGPELIDIQYLSKLQLKVARVEAAEAVPKSKKLVRLQIDLGPQLGKRQIPAGILPYYAPETLVGRKIIVVVNLQPATLMGIESQGMLLAALTEDRSRLALLTVSEDLPEGSAVS
jgi:methionyl-tRNA synthetase